MERLIDPAIADLQIEYAQAIGAGRTWIALRALFVGYMALAKVLVVCGLRGTKQAHDNWDDDDRRNLRRVLWCSAVATLAFAFVVEMPALRNEPAISRTARAGLLLVYLTPAALAGSLPIGILAGTALGLNGRPLSRRLLGCVLLAAIMTSAGAFANVGWVVPASNQLYREEFVGRSLLKGDHELTLIELRRAALQPSGSNPARHARRLGFLYHRRLALAGAPLMFAVFAILLTTRRRLRRVAAVVVTCIVIACTIFMWILGEFLSEAAVVPPRIGAWLPQIVLVYASLLLAAYGPRGKIASQTRA